MTLRKLAALAACAFVAACTQEPEPDRPSAQVAQQADSVRLPEFADYPVPRYLPAGYAFLKEDAARPDGFHDRARFGEDVKQRALIYRGPSTTGGTGGMRFPVMFFATKQHGLRFSGTEGREGTPHRIRFADGTETTATYWDGMWAPPRVYDSAGKPIAPPAGTQPIWSRENFHALVYRWGDYTIGIRGSRLTGVTFEELVKVAESTARPQ